MKFRFLAPFLALALVTACEKGGNTEAKNEKTESQRSAKGSGDEAKGESAEESEGGEVNAAAEDEKWVELKVVEGRSGVYDTGFIHIVGEMHNESSHWVRAPRVDIKLMGKDGEALGVESIATVSGAADGVVGDRYYVPPGGISVFEYVRDTKDVDGKYHSHELKAKGIRVDIAPKVEIVNFEANKNDLGYYKLTGKIENTGKVPCRGPAAVFGLYDADGNILRADLERSPKVLKKRLQPGESIEFERTSFKAEGDVETAEVKKWASCALTKI